MLCEFIRVFPLFIIALLHKTNILFCYVKVNRIKLLLINTVLFYIFYMCNSYSKLRFVDIFK